MKERNYELGRKYSQKLVQGIAAQSPDLVATDCPLSGLRLEKELGRPAFHPIELMNTAYGLLPVRTERESWHD